MAELSQQQVQELLSKWFRKELEEDEHLRIIRKPLTEDDQGFEVSYYFQAKSAYTRWLAKSDYSKICEDVEKLLEQHNLKLPHDSITYRQICREMLKLQIKLNEIFLNREMGNYEGELFQSTPAAPIIQERPKSDFGVKLSEVIKRYCSEAKVNWTVKSANEIPESLNLLVEGVGNIDIQNIDRKTMARFKEMLKQLPPNRSKKYPGKTVHEISQMKFDKTLAERTINKHLTRIGTLFDFAIRHGIYEGPNPALKMHVPLKKGSEKFKAFDQNDLIKLFHSQEYLEDTHLHPYQFWTPILALFTGARQNELAQLYITDIQQEDGIWYIDINDNASDKKLKTKSAKRKVPLHPFLVNELSLIKMVQKCENSRLWPEIPFKRDGYGQRVSRWFNERYKVKYGIISSDKAKKDFHSFRATFITALATKVPYQMLKQLVGHSRGKDTTVEYIDKYSVKQLFEKVILKLDYDIDLNHLKKSKFVPK